MAAEAGGQTEPETAPSRAERREAKAAERSSRPSKRPGRRPSKRELERDSQAARQRRRDLADQRHIDRIRKRLELHGCTLGREGFRLIPRHVWLMCWDILADPSGRSARIWLRRERNKIAVGCIRLAALACDGAGDGRYTWTDERARRICALGLALCALAIPTRRRGPWQSIVRAIPRGALLALLASPWETDRKPSMTGLVGTHRPGATMESGQVGYLLALELAGLCYAQQLPASQVAAHERCWPSGYASNRYWIVTSTPTAPESDDTKRVLLALHEAGRLAPNERLVRKPRLPRQRPVEPRERPS